MTACEGRDMKIHMKIILTQLLLISCAFLVFAPESSAAEQVSVAKVDNSKGAELQPAVTDKDLLAMEKEFNAFVHSKVKQFNSNLIYKKDKLQVVQLDDGSYKARFHEIDKTTLKSNVSRSASKSSPYVGVLSYQEKIYEARGDSASACRKGKFAVVQITPNRHIFSYSKGNWR